MFAQTVDRKQSHANAQPMSTTPADQLSSVDVIRPMNAMLVLCQSAPGVESTTTIRHSTEKCHQLITAIDSTMFLALMHI